MGLIRSLSRSEHWPFTHLFNLEGDLSVSLFYQLLSMRTAVSEALGFTRELLSTQSCFDLPEWPRGEYPEPEGGSGRHHPSLFRLNFAVTDTQPASHKTRL